MDRGDLTTKLLALSRAVCFSRWTFFSIAATLPLFIIWRLQKLKPQWRLNAASNSDPGLLRKHSSRCSYTTPSGLTYPSIRTFYKKHYEASKLPQDLPLLVFMHGLGGSASQFVPLMTSLVSVAPCLAIDLPGCGLSELKPSDVKAYSTHALAELLATVISSVRDVENDQKVILIGHSMGCSTNALLTSSTSPLSHLMDGSIIGMVAVNPRGTSLRPNEASMMRRMASIPAPLFDLLRLVDRRGGTASRSVTRVVGRAADEETRKLQMKYNEQSLSATFLRITAGSLGRTGMPGKEVWSGIKVPLFLVAGEADGITPAQEVEMITAWLSAPSSGVDIEQAQRSDTSASAVSTTESNHDKAVNHVELDKTAASPPRTNSGSVIKDDHTSTKHSFALKTTIFPDPAAHGLMYSTSTTRILSGMIANFISQHIDERLGGGWQLKQMTTSGKWDVKNLKKWQGVDPCSKPIGGVLRAMKTMREVDEAHSPKQFVKHYGFGVLQDGVAAVVDISHETPVYHPQGLEDAGVEYHKFPTVSKEVPTADEVDRFIALIDSILQSPKFHPPQPSHSDFDSTQRTVAVHCHYGFNRTGVLLVCYLVERQGWKLQDAIEEFARKRPPKGIKHPHFINELYVRYGVKMARRDTVVG